MSFNQKAQSAFKKLGAVALITATLAMCFTACNQTGGTGGGGGKQGAPFVEGGASLILSPDNLTIKVRAKTADSSAITVEGCNETTLESGKNIELHATGSVVTLKGKITELYCFNNKLTALNVQGLTALQTLWCYSNQLTTLNIQGCASLQELYCYSNKLNAEAMTALLNALPTRTASDDGYAFLYTKQTGVSEGNHKDFSQPENLKKAFDGAKSRNWRLLKAYGNGSSEEI